MSVRGPCGINSSSGGKGLGLTNVEFDWDLNNITIIATTLITITIVITKIGLVTVFLIFITLENLSSVTFKTYYSLNSEVH